MSLLVPVDGLLKDEQGSDEDEDCRGPREVGKGGCDVRGRDGCAAVRAACVKRGGGSVGVHCVLRVRGSGVHAGR